MKTIGLGRYQYLKGLNPKALSQEDLELIKSYEGNKHTQPNTQALIDYNAKLNASDNNAIPEITSEELFKLFCLTWHQMFPKNKLELHEDMITNLRVLNRYFARDERFAEGCSMINESEPSLDKGLILLGGYGNAKTSSMLVMQKIFLRIPGMVFKRHAAKEVVDMWEASDKPELKQSFWSNVLTGKVCFDDVKSEPESSNYGKKEIFRDILEKRNDQRMLGDDDLKEYITCNYHNDYPNDLVAGIEEFGEKYGNRVYDRLFQDYNIIHWLGKSMRK